MQYIYSAMVLYSAGKEITEDAITAILTAAGVEVDAAKVKAPVASLEGVDINEAIALRSVLSDGNLCRVSKNPSVGTFSNP